MGNSGSTNNSQFISAESEFAVQLSPSAGFTMPAKVPSSRLRFHAKHGDHVDISQDGMVAKRIRSYCKGIVFTNRPVEVGEMVCFRVKEQSNKQQQWSGSLRIGLTIHDPKNVSDLTNVFYLCPDLTNKPGFWAKPLPDSVAVVENIIHFQCQTDGTIFFGLNGVFKGVAFDNIDTGKPLWAVFDVYGTTVAVELLDPSVLERFSERNTSRSIIMGLKHRAGQLNQLNQVNQLNQSNQLNQLNPLNQLNQLNLSEGTSSPRGSALQLGDTQNRRTSVPFTNGSRSSLSHTQSSSVAHLPLQLNIANVQGAVQSGGPLGSRPLPTTERNTNNVRFRPVHFTQLQLKCIRFNRELTGRNAILTDEGRSARLAVGEFNNGYVFLPRAMLLNETLVIRIEETDWDFEGGLTFGLTTCDPASLCQGNLPDDADCFLDRPEYWIVAKDVATKPKKNDEFAFTIKKEGGVSLSRNNNKPTDFLFVDSSQTFWMFFELFGTTRKISLLGYCNSPAVQTHSQTQPRNPTPVRSTPPTVAHPTPPPHLTPSPLTVNLPRTQSYKATPSRTPIQNNGTTSGGFSDLIDFTVDLPGCSPRSGNNSGNNSVTQQYGRTSSQTALAVGRPTTTLLTTPLTDNGKSQLDRSHSVPPGGSNVPPGGSDSNNSNREDECCICFENEINAVVYTCGHQVMCYLCAMSHFRSGKACPVCRGEIKDIIKTYRP